MIAFSQKKRIKVRKEIEMRKYSFLFLFFFYFFFFNYVELKGESDNTIFIIIFFDRENKYLDI